VTDRTIRRNHTDRVTVLLADDHPVYRAGLARTINRRQELDLIAESESGREALDAIREQKPQVAVIDLMMHDLGGLAILDAVKREKLEAKIVVLTGNCEPGTAYSVMASGAAGFLSKTCEPTKVCETISVVARGAMYLAPELHGTFVDQILTGIEASSSTLSKREGEVLKLTAGGNTAVETAERLNVGTSTIKTHLEHTYEKLGVNDRAAAVAEAMRRGWME